MANVFETSFIPQQPILKVEGGSHRREPLNAALILALILFFVSVTVAGGVYFYGLQVDKRVVAKATALEAAEKFFNIDEINTYKRVDVRLGTAKKLVDSHALFTVILNLFEAQATQNVALSSLSYTRVGKDITVLISGQATNYAAVYSQGEAWRAAAPFVEKVEMNQLMLDDQTGIVTFTSKLTLDPSYAEALHVSTVNSAPVPENPKPALPPLPPGASPASSALPSETSSLTPHTPTP